MLFPKEGVFLLQPNEYLGDFIEKTTAHSIVKNLINIYETKSNMVALVNAENFASVITNVLRFINKPDEFKSYQPLNIKYDELIEDNDFRTAYLKKWSLFANMSTTHPDMNLTDLIIPFSLNDIF